MKGRLAAALVNNAHIIAMLNDLPFLTCSCQRTEINMFHSQRLCEG